MKNQPVQLRSYNPQFDVHTLTDLCPLTPNCFKDHQNQKLHNDLQKQALMLTSLIAGMGAAILLVNDQGKVELTNQKFCSLFGIFKSPEDVRGTDACTVMTQASALFTDSSEFMEAATEILKNRVPVRKQNLSTKSGQFYQRDFLPVWNDNVYMGYVWIYQNITDTILANLELQSQQDFYEKILNNIPAEITVLNNRQEYVFVNPHEITDPKTRNWLIGKTDIDLCFKSDKPAWVAARRQHLFSEMLETREQKSWEEQSTNDNGYTTYQHRTYFPVFDHSGQLEMAIGFSLDITESKKTEQESRATEARYRDLFNYSQALILTHDLKGEITRVNPAVCKLLDCKETELLGQSIALLIKTERTAHYEHVYLDGLINTKKAEGVFEITTRSGETKSLLYNNYLVGEGSAAYVIGFAQDITLRVQAEQELQTAKKLTEDTANAKTRFLTEMSHEIRTPLNGILGISQLLSSSKMSEDQKRQLGYLQESANNLLMIVNDILDLEKISSGKMTLENKCFNVSGKVHAAFSCFQPMATSKNIVLEIDNRLPENMLVKGDSLRLIQVINNLLSNAIKFTETGSVTLLLDITEKSAEQVKISFLVQDTGIGIPDEQLGQLFEPFVQGRSDISRRFGGSGLGLAICRQLVSMQKGTLEVESDQNIGSRFCFELTFPLEDSQIADSPLTLPGKRLEGKRILVAEDIPLNQFIVRSFLEAFGCIVETADNGEIAVTKLQSAFYDLVLMDLQMPVMSGFEATALIRSNPDKRIANIPIIALTANAIKGAREECLTAKMNDYVTKPYKKDYLYSVLERALYPAVL